MAAEYGIRATNRVGMNTNNPHLVTADSRLRGGMAIDKIKYFEEKPSTYTSSYVNGSGIKVGVIQYAHGFTYPPAFMLYQYIMPYDTNNGDGYMTPSAGVLGSSGLIGYADSQYITIDGLSYNFGSSQNGPNGGWMVLVIFKENLDATT